MQAKLEQEEMKNSHGDYGNEKPTSGICADNKEMDGDIRHESNPIYPEDILEKSSTKLPEGSANAVKNSCSEVTTKDSAAKSCDLENPAKDLNPPPGVTIIHFGEHHEPIENLDEYLLKQEQLLKNLNQKQKEVGVEIRSESKYSTTPLNPMNKRLNVNYQPDVQVIENATLGLLAGYKRKMVLIGIISIGVVGTMWLWRNKIIK